MALLESKVAARAALLFMVITTTMVLNLPPSNFVQGIGVQGISTIIHLAFMDIGLLILTMVFFFFFSFCSGLQQHADVHSWQLPAALYIVGVYQVYRLGLLHDGNY